LRKSAGIGEAREYNDSTAAGEGAVYTRIHPNTNLAFIGGSVV